MAGSRPLAAVCASALLEVSDWALFETAKVSPDGRAVLWRIGDKIVELSADVLWRMAHPEEHSNGA